MNRVVVSRPYYGLCTMQVCAVADATDEEILKVCNLENPAGTTNGWTEVVRDDKERPQNNPVVCANDEGRLHFRVNC